MTLTLIRTEADGIHKPDPTKAFIILSRSSGLVLEVPGASNSEQTKIQQSSDNGGQHQHWQFIPVDSGFFKVRSLSSGLVLEVAGASHDDHAPIQQSHDNGGQHQHWQFIPVTVPPTDLPFPVLPASGQFFKIRSRLSGKVLDVPGRSADPQTVIQQFSDSGGNGHGNLEVIARVGDRLVGFFRPDQPPFQWQPASAPAFIGVGGGATQRGDLVVSGILVG